MKTKTVPFNYDKFKASVDAGKPFQLCDSGILPSPIEFVGFANTRKGIFIVGVHKYDLCDWQIDGVFNPGKSNVMDLQMQIPDVPARNEADEFAEWLETYDNPLSNSFPISLDIFRKDGAKK